MNKIANDNKVHIMEHPLIQHKLTLLRDKSTSSKEFGELVSEITMLMVYEATRDLPLSEVEIETPLGVTKTKVISGGKLAVVPVLRAGLGMINGVTALVPSAKVGHVGVYRNPDNFKPIEYYCKLPMDISKRDVIILDPVMATGGTAAASVESVKARGAKNIKFMCLIAAPEGLGVLKEAHPDIQIYCAALDSHVDENGYIVPGLGDAGDRMFGTK